MHQLTAGMNSARMSTKCTISHGEDFHFYHEVLDDDHVYLELDTTHFEAGYGRVMLPIPIHIWETIRHLGGARLDLVDKADDSLLTMVERDVDQRIADYQQALSESRDRAGFVALFGCLPYGTADSPRDDQIHRGMEYFQRERQRQLEVKARIAALRKADPTSGASDETE
jgi:hypothetical protein